MPIVIKMEKLRLGGKLHNLFEKNNILMHFSIQAHHNDKTANFAETEEFAERYTNWTAKVIPGRF